MAFLHEDGKSFEYLLTAVSGRSGISPAILEKDYYVTFFLEQLAQKQKSGVKAYFKGGTALYKNLKTVGRFSEDIDIGVNTIGLSRTQNDKRLSDVTKKYEGLERLANEGVTNRQSVLAVYAYKPIFNPGNDVLDRFGKIKIEADSFTISEPTETIETSSLLYDFADKREKDILDSHFMNKPFLVETIALERMFVDKLFAAETYINKMETEDRGLEASKHLYDITVMTRLPRIQSFLSNEPELGRIIGIRFAEERTRLGGIGGLQPKDFKMFDKIKNNEKLKDEFTKMEEIYVIFDKYKFGFKTVNDSLDRLHGILLYNSSWTKEYPVSPLNNIDNKVMEGPHSSVTGKDIQPAKIKQEERIRRARLEASRKRRAKLENSKKSKIRN